MYVVIVQDDLLVVTSVIQCDTLAMVQEVLESLEPNMDSENLLLGNCSTITYGNSEAMFTYSFQKLIPAHSMVNDY